MGHLVPRHPGTHSVYSFRLACMSSAFCVHTVTVITQIGGSRGCCALMDWTLVVNLRGILISPVGSFWFNWGSHIQGSVVSVIYRSEILNHRQPFLGSRQGTHSDGKKPNAQQKSVQRGNHDQVLVKKARSSHLTSLCVWDNNSDSCCGHKPIVAECHYPVSQAYSIVLMPGNRSPCHCFSVNCSFP